MKSVKEELLETMQLTALQQQKSHKMMIDAASALGTALASAFIGSKNKNKKKKKSNNMKIILSDSSSSSDLDSD